MAEYIEREAALAALCIGCSKMVPPDERDPCRYRFAGCMEYYSIFELVAADVRPVVHGHWIWKRRHRGGFKTVSGVDAYGNEHTIIIDDRYEIDDPYCSECGLLNDSSSLKFCPNCGVKMEVSDHGNG